jgi:hypothetical protein
MFDLGTMINLELIGIDARASVEGRKATREEIESGVTRIWNAWMEAQVYRDMTAAGFIKSANGEWKSPRRGFWARLFG